ncbi:hypothetical protein NL529_27875, partial [Klebsiella pneumoniae]|nr:hypothetical protein [Klebsiella pneumoniae]
MSAPLILKNKNDEQDNIQDVTLLLTDFSFKSPEQIWQELRQPHKDMTMHAMSKSSKMDLNDVKYDAFLVNYHTLTDPQIIQVQPGQKIRLRF